MRKKIKNVARVIFAFCIVMLLINCEKENIDANSQDASVTNAKNWFEKSNPELTILKETKQIDWDHAIVTDGAKGKVVEVPIVLKDNLAVKGDDKSLTTHNRLMFIIDEKGMYKLSHVLITTKESKFASSDKDFNFYKIRDDFEGYITILNAKNKVSYINAITKKASSITSKMKIEDQVCLAMCKMYNDGSYDVLYIISCGGGASSGGAGSDGSGGYGDVGGDAAYAEEKTPPSCSSFNFTKTSSNWQQSAVQNIRFVIVILNPQGYYISHIVEYPQAVLFGCPTNLTVGNTSITPGMAAELSARALKISMDETRNVYAKQPVDDLTVRLYFEERLRSNYPLLIPGGRVNFNASTFVGIPTQYQTSFLGTDNCN